MNQTPLFLVALLQEGPLILQDTSTNQPSQTTRMNKGMVRPTSIPLLSEVLLENKLKKLR
jgi:hypothetical protein